MKPSEKELATGARNLLRDCGSFEPGEAVLIVHEDPALGWYDLEAPQAVFEEARRLGLKPAMARVDGPQGSRDAAVDALISEQDNVVFFARIGDQDRFADPVPGRTVVMSYIRSAAMLASPYGRTAHSAMLALKQAVNDILANATRIEITCPLGTRVAGQPACGAPHGDVSVRRFPMGVPAPVPAAGFSGRVALGAYLTPTGSRAYEPASVAMADGVFAVLDHGRITAFEGPGEGVLVARSHYDHVSQLFGIDRDFVHSWHAGIHPGARYDQPVEADPDRWSNTIFTSPRYLHFHTCGAYAPGEICWMVADPTVEVDGVALWKHGTLQPANFDILHACVQGHEDLQRLFAS